MYFNVLNFLAILRLFIFLEKVYVRQMTVMIIVFEFAYHRSPPMLHRLQLCLHECVSAAIVYTQK
jgi:hypothetical protein